ncbi:MAG: hypothetical protein ACI89L_001888 [Phycisphaerales bacterium]|jgi:hypothetical protein
MSDAGTMDQGFDDWQQRCAQIDRLGHVFVCGVAKSGTTWVQRLLNGHPEMVLSGEGGFAWAWLPRLQAAARDFNAHQDTHGIAPHTKLGGEELAFLFRQSVLSRLASYAQASGGADGLVGLKAIGDKTPQHTLAISLLAEVFPRARFVHVVRDPLDAATSAWHHFGAKSGRTLEQHVKWFVTEAWAVGVRAAVQAEQELDGRVRHVRYEDLHAQPERYVGELLAHLSPFGVTNDAASVAACLEAGSFKKATGGRDRGEAQNSAFFRKGVVGDWHELIDDRLAAQVCAPVGDLMQRFEYRLPAAV